MDQVQGFSGYKCAPELFYFAPQDLWYLIWQQQDPAYSTTKTPDNPNSWSAPKRFYPGGQIPKAPQLPLDDWPIADDKNFYLFFTGDDGKVYRVKTSLDKFPEGFGEPVVVKSLNQNIIFEGSSHYKVKGTANTYLHVVEGMEIQGTSAPGPLKVSKVSGRIIWLVRIIHSQVQKMYRMLRVQLTGLMMSAMEN
jgi:hypothetical protein